MHGDDVLRVSRIIFKFMSQAGDVRVDRLLYTLTRPVMPLLRLAFPNSILTTEQLGRAKIAVAQGAESKRILESRDILALSRITQPINYGLVENDKPPL